MEAITDAKRRRMEEVESRRREEEVDVKVKEEGV